MSNQPPPQSSSRAPTSVAIAKTENRAQSPSRAPTAVAIALFAPRASPQSPPLPIDPAAGQWLSFRTSSLLASEAGLRCHQEFRALPSLAVSEDRLRYCQDTPSNAYVLTTNDRAYFAATRANTRSAHDSTLTRYHAFAFRDLKRRRHRLRLFRCRANPATITALPQ